MSPARVRERFSPDKCSDPLVWDVGSDSLEVRAWNRWKVCIEVELVFPGTVEEAITSCEDYLKVTYPEKYGGPLGQV